MVYTLALILISSFCSIVYCCRCTTCQVLTLPFSCGNIFLNMIVDINAYDIYLVCNHDVMMTSLIVDSLKRRRANNIFLLAPLLAPTSDEVSVIFCFVFSWFPMFFHILLKNVSDWHNLSMFIHVYPCFLRYQFQQQASLGVSVIPGRWSEIEDFVQILSAGKLLYVYISVFRFLSVDVVPI